MTEIRESSRDNQAGVVFKDLPLQLQCPVFIYNVTQKNTGIMKEKDGRPKMWFDARNLEAFIFSPENPQTHMGGVRLTLFTYPRKLICPDCKGQITESVSFGDPRGYTCVKCEASSGGLVCKTCGEGCVKGRVCPHCQYPVAYGWNGPAIQLLETMGFEVRHESIEVDDLGREFTVSTTHIPEDKESFIGKGIVISKLEKQQWKGYEDKYSFVAKFSKEEPPLPVPDEYMNTFKEQIDDCMLQANAMIARMMKKKEEEGGELKDDEDLPF